MNEHDLDLFYHALNYRTAPITLREGGAQEAWEALEACVNRLIAREREECAKLCEILRDATLSHVSNNQPDWKNKIMQSVAQVGCNACAVEIRARGNT